MAKQKIIQSEVDNILRSGPARSGKGVTSVIPTLLSLPGRIVFDFDGEWEIDFSGLVEKFRNVSRWEPTINPATGKAREEAF